MTVRRQAAMSVLLACLTAVVGCGDGGSTGDPGVTDHISIDPPDPPMAPPAAPPCDSIPETEAPREEGGSTLRAIAPSEGLWFEVRRGLVVDLSQPDAPRIRGRVVLGELVTVTPLSDRRLLAGVRGPSAYLAVGPEQAMLFGGDELVVLDFADPDAPRVLARAAVPGHVVLVATHEEAAVTRLYAVSDEMGDECMGPTKRSVLYGFELQGEELQSLGEVDLGDDLALVQQRGAQLVLLGGRYREEHEERPEPALRLVSLADAELSPSAPLPAPASMVAPPEVWLSLSDGVLTLVANDLEQGRARVLRYDTGDAPAVLSDCSVELNAGGAWVVGERVFVASWLAAINDGAVSNRMLELDGGCTLLEESDGRWLVSVPGRDAALEVDFSVPGVIEARLRSGAEATVVASARAELPAGADGMAGSSMLLPDAVAWPMGTAVETGLLAVPFQASASGVQLFSFSDDTVTLRASLSPALRLAAAVEGGVATLSDVLATFELLPDAPGPLEPRAELEITPFFQRGYAHDGYLLRQRRPRDFRELDDEIETVDPAQVALLEVVDAAGDPERGEPIARVELAPRASSVLAGDLFVSIENDEFETPGTTRIRVFDLSDPEVPRERGMLETDELWVQDNSGELRGPGIECLDCDAPGGDGPLALATERAVLLRGVRWVEAERGHTSFGFRVIDLTDPDAPRLGESFELPDADHARGAFVSGDDVYYRYMRPLGDGSGRVRFFARRIALSDPSSATLSDPISLPGDLVAARGESLYTVEVVRDGEALVAMLHRLALRGGQAQVQASQALGERAVLSVEVEDERVRVDLGARLNPPPVPIDGVGEPPPPAQLIVLDARDLQSIARGDVAFGVMPLGAQGDAVLYSAGYGVLQVDANDPGDPARQRYVPLSDVPALDLHAWFIGNRAFLSGDGSGRLHAIDTSLSVP